MTEHELKTDPEVFAASWNNRKRFEIRKDDRNFQVGDVLNLRETKYTGEEMKNGKPLMYTGFDFKVRVIYKLPTGSYGLKDGWTVLSVIMIDEVKPDSTIKLEKIKELVLRGDVEPEWAFEQIRNMF